MSDAATRPSSYSYEELLACARGEMFGPGNAQLPAPPMLMFDRIIEINSTGGEHGKGYIEAELDINPDLWFFACHFIGDPVMPGCHMASRPRQPGMTGSPMKWHWKNQRSGWISSSAST